MQRFLKGVDQVSHKSLNFSEVTGLHQRYANTLTEISIRPKLKVGIVIRSVYLQMVFRVHSKKNLISFFFVFYVKQRPWMVETTT